MVRGPHRGPGVRRVDRRGPAATHRQSRWKTWQKPYGSAQVRMPTCIRRATRPTTWQNWPARRWSVGSSDRVATQSILPECGLCVPTSSYARKSSSPYWLASPVPVAGHPKSAPPWIIITSRCDKSSIEPLKPLAWRSPEQQTEGCVRRQHVVVRALIRGLHDAVERSR
jgi:hypothetical protein